MRWLKAVSRRVALSLATGYVLLFFGEIQFWATPEREGMDVPGLALTWWVYSVFAHVFLLVAGGFRVRSPWAVFLAGAVFGWFEEGIILQTTYGSEATPFPQSISFTGLAWHALIDVWAGWYMLRRLLSEGRPLRTAAWAAFLGVFHGVWAIFWWTEPPEPMRALLERSEWVLVGRFTVFAFLTTGVLVAALHLHSRVAGHGPVGSRWERWFFVLATLAWFIGITVPAAPRAVWVLPPLMGLTVFALWRNRVGEDRPDAVVAFPIAGGLRHSGVLMVMPAVASAIHLAASVLGLRLQTNLWIYPLTTWLGIGFWVLSIGMILLHAGRRGGDGPAVAPGTKRDTVTSGSC